MREEDGKDLLERIGATAGGGEAKRLALDFGDPEAETEALRAGCALWVDSGDLIEMTGEDRHRFLNGLITADVLELGSGSGSYGLFTSIKGRILADVLVVALPGRILLRLPAGRGDAIAEHMHRFIITDRVETRALRETAVLMLGGPDAAERLQGWLSGADLPAPGESVEQPVLGIDTRVLRELRGPAKFSIWLPVDVAVDLLPVLLCSEDAPVLVGSEAVESARVEEGIPRFGVDFDDETFPQEADLDVAVSYEKGCYLGQEVVARIHFRGGVNRVLRGLEIDAGTTLRTGDRLFAGGKAVGRVTSAAGRDSTRAIGSVMLAAAEPGGRLELEGGHAVRLVALPFGGG